MAFEIGYMTAERAVERSISHNEIAVLALREDLAPSERVDAGIEELAGFGYEGCAPENDGTVDAWGTHEGHEWRVKLVDGIVHGIRRYVP
jgi:hypothetical protein